MGCDAPAQWAPDSPDRGAADLTNDVHNCAGRDPDFGRFVKAPRSQCRRGFAPVSRGTPRADQGAARVARDSRCTASTSAATFSGGVAGTMPWPRLKMWPGRGPGGAHDRRRLRARRSPGRSAAPAGSRLPCSATRAPTRRARAAMSTVQSRPTADAPQAAISSSHCPPPLVKTIVGTGWPSGAGRERREDRAHRRERERAVGVGGQQPAPGVEDHHRVGAARDLLVEVGGDRPRVDVDEPLQQIGPRVGHLAHGGEVGAAAAFDHVAGERERAAGEADQRHAAGERALDLARPRRTRSASFAMSGTASARDRRLVGASCARSAGPRPRRTESPRPIASGTVRMSENRIAASSGKRASGCSVTSVASAGVLRERHEAAGLRARRVVLGQVAPGLAHQPDRRVRRGLAPQRAQERVVFERGHRDA